MSSPDPSPERSFSSAADFRALARGRLHADPTEAIFDPRTGKVWSRGDFELNPEMLADFAVMPPPRPAAVLVPIVARNPLSVLFTVRTETLPTHAGQIAFPGGKVEKGDGGPTAAALREAEEEIGLHSQFIEPLGFLDSYRSGTGFQIMPVVALVEPGFTLTLEPAEVADVFEVPLAFLMDITNHQRASREWKGRERHFYAMPYGERYIWGATAAIVKNLHDRLFGS
jgi:8-oxo-dGTP pyrophosphatase MutT (NUDIX family)